MSIFHNRGDKTVTMEHDFWLDADGVTLHASVPGLTRFTVRPGEPRYDKYYGAYCRKMAERTNDS